MAEIACPTFLVRAHQKDFSRMPDIPFAKEHPRDLDEDKVTWREGFTVKRETPLYGEGGGFHPLAKLATEITQPPLKAIAERLRLLSYGDMMELATGVGADPAKIWEWANK